MALIKNKMTDFGVEANYWKVNMIAIDRSRYEVSVTLNLYIVKDATQFLETISITLAEIEDREERATRFNQYFNGSNYPNIYTACYEYAKEYIEYFSDAVSDND